MDGTPHLLTDVQFSERRRGYDPEEVDNFLERVSAAVAQLQDKLREITARAEVADAKLADAQRAQAAAEAELARLGGEAPAAPVSTADPEAEAERASRVLLMAQKTADATIDDANTTAQQTIAEARSRAASLVADAEAEAERMRADAKREAEALIEEQRAVVVRDVKELEEVRVKVQSDVDKLQAHFEAEDAPQELAPDTETACFRVAQEAINNVLRHARARNLWVRLSMSAAGLAISVRDDGRGFEVDRVRRRASDGASLGLVGMEERMALAGGSFELRSAPGQGTVLLATFPMSAGRERAVG